jgi:hypothetical protein
MICYNHPEEQAHGICKNCNKGICAKCSTDLGDGLACTASCIDNVEKVNTLVYKNVKTSKVTSNKYTVFGILYIVVGAIVVGFNILDEKRDVVLICFGVFFMAYGAYSISRGIKINQDDRI